jgi:hypothetical protein
MMSIPEDLVRSKWFFFVLCLIAAIFLWLNNPVTWRADYLGSTPLAISRRAE